MLAEITTARFNRHIHCVAADWLPCLITFISEVLVTNGAAPYTYKGYTEHLAPSLPLQSLPGREEGWPPTGEYMKHLPRNLPTWGLKRPNQPCSQGERHQMLLTAEVINSCFATYPLED